MTVITESVDAFGAGGSAGVSAGVGVGAGLDVDYITTEVTGARYFDPETGQFVPWTGCTG